jgi:outer membrane protein assembly factor BamB
MSAARWRRLLQCALGIIVVAVITLAGAGSAVAEVTGAADNLRTGWYPDEPSLTPALLSGASFQQVFKRPLQGQIYAQPLTANGTLLVATEDNWVYGLDPNSGTVRWERQFGTPVNALDAPIECGDLAPHIGITGTPVIDTEHNIAYFVANQYIAGSKTIAWYMHAVELGSGKEVANFPVKIEGHAQNLFGVEFEPAQELQRPALLMMNGVVYAGFGSHCDKGLYEGWVMGVSTSGQVTTKWATSGEGGSIWQSGGGLVSDGPGQILFSTGNDNGTPGEWVPPQGPGNKPPEGRLGESVVRAEVQHEGGLKATDFFSPFNNKELDEWDIDLGSSAPIALPSPYFGTPSVPHLLVQDGKDGYVYLLNRDNLGGMGQGPGHTDQVVQKLGPYGGVWDGSAVWPGDGGYVYIPSVAPAGESGGSSDHLRFFRYGVDGETGEPTLSLAGESPDSFGFGSGSPIVTSDATASGTAILWITRCPPTTCEGADLRAYSPVPIAGSPNVLWEAPIGTANKFSRPDASNGHVYVGNREGDVFGYSGPALTPSTTSLDLGAGPVKGRLTGEVAFTNTGTKLTVSAVRLPSGPFEATGLPAVGTVIEPGQVITVGVAFESSALGSFAGSLGLTTAAGETNIALSGSAGETPTVVTKAASSLTQTTATLNATVNPNSGEVSECKLEYGTAETYGASAACTPSPGSGTGPVAVSASVGSLTANTTYHFRISATNPSGTSKGSDETFQTVAPTTLPQEIPGGPSLVSGSGVLPFQESKTPPVPDAKLASTSLAASSSGSVTVKVTCPAGESSCTGTITLRTLTAVIAGTTGHQSKKPKAAILTLAVGSFKVAGGQTTTVKLHLSAQARRLLTRVHVLHARATIVAHDATGATHTLQTTVTIRVAKATQGRKP